MTLAQADQILGRGMIRALGCGWSKKSGLDRVNNTQIHVYSFEKIGYANVWLFRYFSSLRKLVNSLPEIF